MAKKKGKKIGPDAVSKKHLHRQIKGSRGRTKFVNSFSKSAQKKKSPIKTRPVK